MEKSISAKQAARNAESPWQISLHLFDEVREWFSHPHLFSPPELARTEKISAPPVPEKRKLEVIPLNFELVDSATGVAVYKAKNDYVLSLDLASGAKVGIVSGEKVEEGKPSVYGGADPFFKRMNAEEAFKSATNSRNELVCVSNAGFFSTLLEKSAPVAFAFKRDKVDESDGFAAKDKHEGKRLTLSLGEGYAKLSQFNNRSILDFRKIPESSAVVSLDPSVDIDKQSSKAVGRTFVGLSDPDSNGNYRRLFLFVSSASSQAHASETLRSFGADKFIMFDGGGSSQLRCRSGEYVPSVRTVPQYFAFYSSETPLPRWDKLKPVNELPVR